MKKIKYLLLGIFAFVIGMISISAAPSFSFTVNRASIENGGSVSASVKVSNAAAWDLSISSAGNTNGCSERFLDDSGTGNNTTKTFSVTCKSNSVGTIAFTISGYSVSADGSRTNFSGTKTVSVITVTPKSSNNNLSALGVTGYEITPNFSSGVLEYSLTVPNGTTSIEVNATKEDSKSTVSGIGTISVVEGQNIVEVTVSAQNGALKKYVISVTVLEPNPINVSVNGKDYSLVRRLEDLPKPDNYTETVVEISGEEVPAYYSEITKYTLVGLKDENGNIKLYIYNENDESYKLYVEIKAVGLIFNPLVVKDIPKGYEKNNCKINEEDIECYKIDDSEFALIYGMNSESGDEGWYIYDKKEGTLQRFNEKLYSSLNEKTNNYFFVACVFGGALALAIILIFVIIFKNKKKSKPKKITS